MKHLLQEEEKMHVRVIFFGIKQKSKRGFEKDDMYNTLSKL